MVVGIRADEQRHENEDRLRRTGIDRKRPQQTTAMRKTIVRPASRMLSAISFGVFANRALDERDHPVGERFACWR